MCLMIQPNFEFFWVITVINEIDSNTIFLEFSVTLNTTVQKAFHLDFKKLLKVKNSEVSYNCDTQRMAAFFRCVIAFYY